MPGHTQASDKLSCRVAPVGATTATYPYVLNSCVGCLRSPADLLPDIDTMRADARFVAVLRGSLLLADRARPACREADTALRL